jgi:hypothetical protein
MSTNAPESLDAEVIRIVPPNGSTPGYRVVVDSIQEEHHFHDDALNSTTAPVGTKGKIEYRVNKWSGTWFFVYE